MTLTLSILEKSQGILDLHPEVHDWTGKNYGMFDDGGVEIEVGEFLYGFIRLLKPANVLTTGIYTGISDAYIASALKDNDLGNIMALELNQFHIDRARRLWEALGLSEIIRSIKTSSMDFGTYVKFDFMFLDTEPDIRFKELIKFYPQLAPGGYVFIHDLHSHMGQTPNVEHGFGWPFGELPKQIIDWVKDGELRPFHFRNPRGLTGFYKTSPEDFKFL